MTRRIADDPLDRALVRPARLLAGYAAAVCSWPVVLWLFGSVPEPFPKRWAELFALMFVLWLLACRRQRQLEARAVDRRSRPTPGETSLR